MNCPFIPVTRTRRGRPKRISRLLRILEAERLELDEAESGAGRKNCVRSRRMRNYGRVTYCWVLIEE